jgi:hypothetical protein
MTKDFHFAAALGHQRGDDSDGGGLACPIGAEQGEEIAFFHIEIDTFKRLNAVFVSLGELAKRKSFHSDVAQPWDNAILDQSWPRAVKRIKAQCAAENSAGREFRPTKTVTAMDGPNAGDAGAIAGLLRF